jgi:IPT/TIG domain
MSARKRVFVLGCASAAVLTVAGAVPAFAQIYGGQAYAVQLTGVRVGTTTVTDQIVDGTGPLPPGGGTVNGTAGSILLPSGLGSATVTQEQASGALETSSATSQISSIALLPNTALPTPLTGTGVLSGNNLSVSTSLTCGAPNSIATSTGTLVVAGVAVTIPNAPNTSVNVTAPATGSAVLATVTFNFQNSIPGAVKGSSIIVSFPTTGPLASLIQGQVTISHAESTLICPPAITSVGPNAGPTAGGNTVTISGTGFTGATGVSFGGTPSPNFQVNSDGSITAVAPPGAVGTVDTRVTAPAGTSAVVSADSYSYFPVPSITSVSPNSGSTGGGTVVTIRGSGLSGATGVSFGGTPAQSFVVNPDGSITAVAPAGAAGVVDITVTTPGGTSTTDPADRFTFLLPGPPTTGRLVVAGGGPLAPVFIPIIAAGIAVIGGILRSWRIWAGPSASR